MNGKIEGKGKYISRLGVKIEGNFENGTYKTEDGQTGVAKFD